MVKEVEKQRAIVKIHERYQREKVTRRGWAKMAEEREKLIALLEMLE